VSGRGGPLGIRPSALHIAARRERLGPIGAHWYNAVVSRQECDLDAACGSDAFLEQLNALFAGAVRPGDEEKYLQDVLDLAMDAAGGDRAFLALVEQRTGELVVVTTAGLGWTPETTRLRLSLAQESGRGITGHVALTAQPYRTGDVIHDAHYVMYFRDVRSEVAVPICGTSGQSIGVINIESAIADRFTPLHVERLVAVAHAAASALRVRGFRARETALIEIGNNLTTTLDIEALMGKVLGVAAEMLRFEDCTVFLLDEASGRLVLSASRGILADRLGETPYRVGEGITGWVAEAGQPVRLERPQLDPRWRGLCVEFPQDEIGALLAVPIVGRSRILGVMRVVRRRSATALFSNAFSEGEERILTSIGRQVGAAVENVRSYERLVRAERMAAWGELSARAAHMIGNRTFAIKGDLNELTYLLDERPCEDIRAEIKDLAASMNHGVARLEEILREFRDFVVATQLTLGTCSVNDVIQEAIGETFPKRTRIKLRTDLTSGLPSLRCDARKLKRAFAELVENAVSFQPEGGMLAVRSLALSRDELLKYGLSQGREYILVEFRDCGPGVDDGEKERIFLPFHTTRAKGMGLGLSIVKGIVEAHQGFVREIGESGEGARFVVFLPVPEAGASE